MQLLRRLALFSSHETCSLSGDCFCDKSFGHFVFAMGGTNLSKEVEQLAKRDPPVVELNVASKKVSSLPDQIVSLHALKRLNASNNKIKYVTPQIDQLRARFQQSFAADPLPSLCLPFILLFSSLFALVVFNLPRDGVICFKSFFFWPVHSFAASSLPSSCFPRFFSKRHECLRIRCVWQSSWK